MGQSSSTNIPPRHFVGDWTNGKSTVLIIHPDGTIYYKKQGWNTTTTVNVRGFYDADGFHVGKMYSPKLQGFYQPQCGVKACFVVNGDLLRKGRYGSTRPPPSALQTSFATLGAGGINIQVGGVM